MEYLSIRFTVSMVKMFTFMHVINLSFLQQSYYIIRNFSPSVCFILFKTDTLLRNYDCFQLLSTFFQLFATNKCFNPCYSFRIKLTCNLFINSYQISSQTPYSQGLRFRRARVGGRKTELNHTQILEIIQFTTSK